MPCLRKGCEIVGAISGILIGCLSVPRIITESGAKSYETPKLEIGAPVVQ